MSSSKSADTNSTWMGPCRCTPFSGQYWGHSYRRPQTQKNTVNHSEFHVAFSRFSFMLHLLLIFSQNIFIKYTAHHRPPVLSTLLLLVRNKFNQMLFHLTERAISCSYTRQSLLWGVTHFWHSVSVLQYIMTRQEDAVKYYHILETVWSLKTKGLVSPTILKSW